MTSKTQRILILGGGFGGLYAALRLEKIFSGDESVEITLVSEENFLLFTPMLPEVPSGSIEAKHIVSPLRAFFRKVKFQNANVESIDLQSRVVVASHCGVCGPRELKFDHLVLALGSITQFHGLVGVAENAFPMKTLSDAMVLRNHIIDVFEHADMQSEPAAREAMLTFVVAGGGFAGAETVAELHDFAYTVRRYYSNIRPEEVKVVLVHSGARIMPEISETLAVYAANKLKTKGIDVVLNTRVASAASDWVDLSNGQRIVTRTLIWTTGVTPGPLLATTSCQRNKLRSGSSQRIPGGSLTPRDLGLRGLRRDPHASSRSVSSPHSATRYSSRDEGRREHRRFDKREAHATVYLQTYWNACVTGPKIGGRRNMRVQVFGLLCVVALADSVLVQIAGTGAQSAGGHGLDSRPVLPARHCASQAC